MKILELFGEPFSDGGQEAFVINMLQVIDMTDISIDVFTPYYCDNEFYKGIVESKGGKVTCCNLPFTPGKSRENIKPVIREYLQNNTYDVVHIHTGSVSVLALAAEEAKQCGVKKVIVHAHTGSTHKNAKHELVKVAYMPRIAKNADCFCACSRQAALWQFSKAIAEQKTVIVKNGIAIDKYIFNESTRDAIRAQLNIEKEDYVIGNVGRFSDEKNQMFLIPIIQKLVKDNKRCKMILVGAGDNFAGVEKKIRELALTESVLLTGSVNNVNEYLQAMDVFVVPSRYEGLSLVSIEAQAAGLPIIASDNVPADIKLSSDVVFLSLEDDVQAWCEQIMRFQGYQRRNNQELINQAGFNVANTAEQLRNLYLE